MQQCIISANCQGIPLIMQMGKFLPFVKNYCVEYYINFKKEIIPLHKLAECDLLIYQKLDDSWGELSEKYLLEHVNPKAHTVCMPNIANKALWPISKGTGNLKNPYNETYVDELLARNLSVDEIIYLVRKVDFAQHYDLQALFEESMRVERSKNYAGCDEICDFIEENFSKERLFSTYNHPCGALLNKAAQIVLREIGFDDVPERLIENIVCEENYFMPVHPSVARFFGLDFIGENTKYPVYGNMLTYYEYIKGYVYAKQNNVALAPYFSWVAEQQNKNAEKS